MKEIFPEEQTKEILKKDRLKAASQPYAFSPKQQQSGKALFIKQSYSWKQFHGFIMIKVRHIQNEDNGSLIVFL